MNKRTLQLNLKIVSSHFEKVATREQIEKFKSKYKGIEWNRSANGYERSLTRFLIETVDTALWMKFWISNIIHFMDEHGILLYE